MKVLHSKLFRKNLKKWLLMYIIVIGFLTTIITYSKYISSIKSQDSARVAKFNVDIKNLSCSNTDCNTGEKRPTEKIEYDFEVTTDLEVKTNVFLTAYISNKFNYEIYDVTTTKEKVDTTSEKEIEGKLAGEVAKVSTWNITIPAGSKITKKYKIIVNYKSESDSYKEIKDTPYNIVRIDYSAIQVQ